MLLRFRWFLTRLGIARKYQANLRNGFEIVKMKEERHEEFLIANRQKQKEQEEYFRGWLECIDWMVKNVRS